MNYDESSIKIMEGLEAVRKRPGMYIGSTDRRGLYHLVWEIVDNSIDEVSNKYGDTIKIILHKDNSVTVSDNGRGIPVGRHESGISTPEVIFTILHAGGKFETGGYKTSGGLHGVGASVVNALSKYMVVDINRDGYHYRIEFHDGGKVYKPLEKLEKTNKTGTIVKFLPDDSIFSESKFSFTNICERARESAYLIPNLTIEVVDEEDDKSVKFHYAEGLKEFIDFINEDKEKIGNVLSFSGSSIDGIEVNIALQYTEYYSENIISFVNNVKTSDGGTHEIGFKSAITKSFNEYLRENNLLTKNMPTFDGVDVREGLSAVISLYIREDLLQFESQTKSKLGTSIAKNAVEQVVLDNFPFYLRENIKTTKTLIDKINRSRQARLAAKKARDNIRKNKDNKLTNLSGKLTPAQYKNPKKNELFLVEGTSAGGSAKGGRDKKYQAILPLRGKVLNAEKASIEDVLKNEELVSIISAIGAGYGSNFNVDEMEYDKVIIMTDADFDGAHIQCLLLTFFYRFMKDMINAGKLYIAMPPLYKLTFKDKTYAYSYTEEDKKELSRKKEVVNIQRYKGLGEMNAEQLGETTMDIKTRSIIKVANEDSVLSDKKVSILMGDEIQMRKDWIEENVDFTLEDGFKKEV